MSSVPVLATSELSMAPPFLKRSLVHPVEVLCVVVFPVELDVAPSPPLTSAAGGTCTEDSEVSMFVKNLVIPSDICHHLMGHELTHLPLAQDRRLLRHQDLVRS